MVINVRLAVQVLNKSVTKYYEYYPEELHGTTELCEKMDRFFDCLNVRNQKGWSNTNLSYDHSKILTMKDFIGWKMYFKNTYLTGKLV